MSTPFSDQELIKRIRWYVAVRWFFVLAIGLPGIISLGLLLGSFSDGHVVPNIGILVTILGINGVILLSTYLPVRINRFYELLSISQIWLDIAVMTTAFQVNGGLETPLVMLYCIPILMSGVLLSKRAVYMTGFGATFIFVMFTTLDFLNIFEPTNIASPDVHTNPAGFWPTVITTSMILIVVTFVTNFVASFVRKSSQLAGELKGAKIEKAKTDAIIQSMGSSLIAVNNKGKVVLANQAFERLTGWYSSEIENLPAMSFLEIVKDDGKSATAELEKAFNSVLDHDKRPEQQTPTFVGDTFLKRKNGSTFAFTGKVSSIDVDGKSIGAAFIFDDASALREVGQLKSNFIALASHQLKTPIGEIKNYSESMLGGTTGKLNEKQQRYLERMRDISTRANQLVTYLLDMSLLERGELRAKLQPVPVHSLLEDVAELYQGRAKKKGLHIKVVGDKDLVVHGDEMMLQEVIGSLIANGISYTDKGTIELSATTVGAIGCIEIADQGKGIEKEKLDQIFHKESVLAGLPESGGNTGLGLYLAYEFVRLQGGVLMVDRNDDKGTIFRIELPVK